MNWADIFFECRRQLGLTQAELAEKLLISLATYKSVERTSRKPSNSVITRLRFLMGLSEVDFQKKFSRNFRRTTSRYPNAYGERGEVHRVLEGEQKFRSFLRAPLATVEVLEWARRAVAEIARVVK